MIRRWFRRIRRAIAWRHPRYSYNGPPVTLAQMDAAMRADYLPALRVALMVESPLMRLIASMPRPEPADPEWVRTIEWGTY